MKRTLLILLNCLALSGCTGNSDGSPKLELNAESVSFCESPSVFNNLQLRNTGSGPLTISKIGMRGDGGCAYTCDYAVPGAVDVRPCRNEGAKSAEVRLEAGQTILVRIGYTAPVEGEAAPAAVVVESNALNLLAGDASTATVVIPLCAGMPVTDGGDLLDAGISDAGTVDVSCSACEEIPEKGAPVCADRT